MRDLEKECDIQANDFVTTDSLDLLGVASPGIIGLLVGLASAKAGGRPVSIHILFAGVGGYVGYIALAFVMRWRDANGMLAFPPELKPSLNLFLVFAIFFYVVMHIRRGLFTADGHLNASIAKQTLLGNVLSSLILAMLLMTTFFVASVNPLSSWDGLDNWAHSAVGLLNYELAPDGFMGTDRTSDGPFPWFHERHPPTFYYIAAFSGFSTGVANIFQGWLSPSSFIWFYGGLVVLGFVHFFSGRYILSTLAAYLYCSLPLLENHALLVGYADPWVLMSVLSAAAVLSLAMCEKSRSLFLVGVLLSLLPITIKNTGMIYSVALLFTLIMVPMLRRFPLALLVVVLGAAPIIFYAINNGFDIQVAGFRFALILSEAYEDGYSRVFFGAAGQLIDPVPPLDIVLNYIWALLINQSFSVIVLFGSVICCVVACRANLMKPEARIAVFYLLLVCVCLLTFFAVPQLISANYTKAYASPHSDMGASRFILIVGPLLTLSLAFLPKFTQFSRKVDCGLEDNNPING